MQHGVYIIPIATGIIYFGVGSSNFDFAVINMVKVNDIITDDSTKTGGQPVLGIRWEQNFHVVTYTHPSPMAPLYMYTFSLVSLFTVYKTVPGIPIKLPCRSCMEDIPETY